MPTDARADEAPRTRAFVKQLSQRYASRQVEIEEDVAEYRGLTDEENDAVVTALARAAMEILRGREDYVQAMADQEAPSADYELLMRKLMARKRS